MRDTFLIIVLGAFLLPGCLESDLEATDKVQANKLTYLDPSFDWNQVRNNPFRIVGITPTDDTWSVIVEYSGGCEEHNFYTWWNGEWEKDNSATFYLIHNANNDMCEAFIRDTISIRLDETFLRDPDPLDSAHITILNASNAHKITVDPELARIAQSDNCQLNTTIKGTLCGQGIWDSQWLLMLDTVTNHNKVWLRPVTNSSKVMLTKPEPGNYTVGVTLLFGYEPIDPDEQCATLPDGSFVSVAVNCIEKQ
ncbi:hypothetical protein [Marinoscillum furvescens]|uniref:Uncharacterized protein n=1 Tax=Marinoscillum furvescens DSM 4134 TaxID=1122208 RepID=A0A3D9L647_MARFU|nr:hypothetical protein [Marinoscillum furvescens]REE01574.1 hypothetical protein C7460_10390 [Marinoscillum furvescens DSM 4134]